MARTPSKASGRTAGKAAGAPRKPASPSAPAPEKSPASPARRTWRRRAAERPDELLDAALDEFLAKGFDAARIEDIARRAGVSKGAVYLYFSSKEELLRALVEREISPLIGRIAAMARAAENPKETLRAIAGMVGGAMANPRFVAMPILIISISNRFPDLIDFYREEIALQAKSAIEILVKRGIAMGQFRKVAPHAAARSLIGPMLFEALWTHVLRGASPMGKGQAGWAQAQIDLLLEGLAA